MTLPVLDTVSGWRLAAEPAPPAASWLQAMLWLSISDEITGQPPRVTPMASTPTPGLQARASGDLAGLVGQPVHAFLPGFITGAPLQLTLSGAGFLPVTFNATMGAEAGYPDTFTPIDLGTFALHREPVTISGRTVSRTGVVRAGAAVSVVGIWLTLADLVNPATAPNLITLASPLYADRGTAATFAAQPLTPAPPSQTKQLLQPANIGDTTVRLSNQVGLTIGSIIAIDPEDAARAEYLEVTAIAALGAGPTFPSVITLAFALTRQHAAGATVQPMLPGATGAANVLSIAAKVGDTTLLPSTMIGMSAASMPIVITGSGSAAEYHVASLMNSDSDANGYMTLPPVHRVAQLELNVHHAAEPVDLVCNVMLPLGVGNLTVDFVFP
ncbi:hypothetical protein OKW35_000455 [Paraburkholderia sp. MM5477-R1]